MKVLLVNGSPRPRGYTAAALSVVQEELEAQGVETASLWIGNQPVRGCVFCGACRDTHRCAFGDDPCNSLIEGILDADGLVVGSPVYFAGPNAALCALMDRAFFATCTYSQLFRGKPAAALATCAWAGGTATLDRLHRYFVPSQMPVVNSRDFLVFPHGEESGQPPDFPQEHQPGSLLRTLAQNMAQYLRSTQD